MNAIHDICRLDYLVGTLATAYRGAVTSLVAKDFCMSDDGVATTFKGTVLSMPDGEYDASLIQGGIELSRVGLRRGYFEFAADSRRIAGARDLQIDILQAGRHIGTFLLKQESAGGIYSSAVELSEELAGIDLTRLTSPLRDKVGLLRKAEELVSQILSVKKDWAAFSEKLNGFSLDVFWSAPEVFYGAYEILVRFSLLAAGRAGAAVTSKPLSDYFDLLELPLANERDSARLRAAAGTWLSALSRSSIDLSPQARHAVDALRDLGRKFPDMDTRGVLLLLTRSLAEKTVSMTFLDDRALAPLTRLISGEDAELLSRFSESGRRRMAAELAGAKERLEKGEARAALETIAGIDADALDDRKAVSVLFDLAEKYLSAASADAFAGVILVFLADARRLSGRALETLRMQVPRLMDRLIAIARPDACGALLRRVGGLAAPLKEQITLDPRVARSVLHSGHGPLIEQYENDLKRITVPAARVQGISSDTWAEIVNPMHLERIEGFMDLLMEGNERLEDILVHVTANLAVGGVLIPDDRLFQRRVSAYLNSRAMSSPFLLNFLLLERLPVYFNEVGAVSRIRDYSTEIDSWGNDPVIYFLRKQVHVNASNHNVRLIEQIMRSWVRNDQSLLKEVVPPDVCAQADPRLIRRYSSVIGPFFDATGVLDAGELHLDRLLAVPDETIDHGLREADGGDAEARRKTGLLCKLYKEIVRKYSLLSRDAGVGDVYARLQDTIAGLQESRRVVQSPEKTEPRESLYFKRHIAFGIPSVLGTYHEPKFDALCDMMRRGEEVPVLLEAVIAKVENKGATDDGPGLRQWLAPLAAAWEVLKLYGMQSVQLDEFAQVLGHNRLSLTQVIDLLKMWQKELAWMVSSLSRTFHGPLMEIIGTFPRGDLPEHLISLDISSSDFIAKAADVVMRDILGSVPGLVESDRLLETLVRVLRSPEAPVAGIEPPVAGRPQERDFYDIHAMTAEDALRLGPDLGSKAKNLVYLKDKGLRIPAGVVLPARHTRNYRQYTEEAGFSAVLREAVGTIEARTGAKFGGDRRPLFLSVRSGSYPSMPGILSSILYCGMNDRTLDAFIGRSGNPRLGWDSYRRFIEHYGAGVHGLDIEFFERIAQDDRSAHRLTAGSPDAAAPREIVGLYQSRLRAMGLVVPADVYEQLRQSVRAVYASWYSERARQFRSATGTSEEWGTSVTLMEMVSGNQEGAGASVFFTRDPSTLEQAVYGETREEAGGDDLASGRTSGRPLPRSQKAAGQKSLEELDPRLFRLHQDLARTIEDAFGGLPQEVEVTYTRDARGAPVLSVLQTRRMEFGEKFIDTFDAICRMESRVIGRGIGANGGALSGVASFAASARDIEMLERRSGLPVILLRKTANTDDVSLMPVIRGIVTASGGVTSHAAVLAQKFGLSAVVACADMKVETGEQGRPFAVIGATAVEEGTAISIDGATGLVFSGTCFPTTGQG